MAPSSNPWGVLGPYLNKVRQKKKSDLKVIYVYIFLGAQNLFSTKKKKKKVGNTDVSIK